jgi:hypothetical protein
MLEHRGLPLGDLISVQIKLVRHFGGCHFALNTGKATLALNADEGLHQGLLVISYSVYGIYDAKNRSLYPLIEAAKIQGPTLWHWSDR